MQTTPEDKTDSSNMQTTQQLTDAAIHDSTVVGKALFVYKSTFSRFTAEFGDFLFSCFSLSEKNY